MKRLKQFRELLFVFTKLFDYKANFFVKTKTIFLYRNGSKISCHCPFKASSLRPELWSWLQVTVVVSLVGLWGGLGYSHTTTTTTSYTWTEENTVLYCRAILFYSQNYKWQNGKDCKGKTMYEQSALARRVRQNFLAEGRLTSSPPLPPTPSGAPTDRPNRYRDRV